MLMFHRVSGLAIATLLLAACAGGGRVSHVEQTSLYSSMTIGFATKGGALATDIRGQPFGGGPIAAESVAAAMKPPGWHRAFRFTTLPVTPVSDYRLILRFNVPVDGTKGEAICAGSEPGIFGPASPTTAVHGVFCLGPRLVSEARAQGGPIQGPDDPAFRALTDALLTEIMPSYNRQVPVDSGSCAEC